MIAVDHQLIVASPCTAQVITRRPVFRRRRGSSGHSESAPLHVGRVRQIEQRCARIGKETPPCETSNSLTGRGCAARRRSRILHRHRPAGKMITHPLCGMPIVERRLANMLVIRIRPQKKLTLAPWDPRINRRSRVRKLPKSQTATPNVGYCSDRSGNLPGYLDCRARGYLRLSSSPCPWARAFLAALACSAGVLSGRAMISPVDTLPRPTAASQLTASTSTRATATCTPSPRRKRLPER